MDFLIFAIGNSSRDILPCEIVYPVLINTAANWVAHSDRRLPNNLVTIASWLSMRASTWQMISTIISFYLHRHQPHWIHQFLFRSLTFSEHWCAEPDYRITTHRKYFHYLLYLICLPLQTARHTQIASFAAKTLSASQKYGENNHKRSHYSMGFIPFCF